MPRVRTSFKFPGGCNRLRDLPQKRQRPRRNKRRGPDRVVSERPASVPPTTSRSILANLPCSGQALIWIRASLKPNT